MKAHAYCLQARLFNDPSTPYKVLIASDAIGMGLNFNIRRVIFSTLMKHTGRNGKAAPLQQFAVLS